MKWDLEGISWWIFQKKKSKREVSPRLSLSLEIKNPHVVSPLIFDGFSVYDPLGLKQTPQTVSKCPLSTSIHTRVIGFQILTDPSWLHLSSLDPSELTLLIFSECPRVEFTFPLCASHSLMVLSKLTLTSTLPSGPTKQLWLIPSVRSTSTRTCQSTFPKFSRFCRSCHW